MTLTYTEAVAMLEALKGKIVLGPWELTDDETEYQRFNLKTGKAYCDVFRTHSPFSDGPNVKWIAGCMNMGSDFKPGVQYETKELAMSAVDAILATRKDILAAGISAATSKESEA